MPTYGYECNSCKHSFDVFQSMKDEPIKKCPECGKAVRRLINGGTGIIFRGNGFYVNDKSAASGGKSSEAAACQNCPMSSGTSQGEGTAKSREACPMAANS